MPVYDSVQALVGHTPLLELGGLQPSGVRILAKLEWFQPGGSAKDRVALAMLEDPRVSTDTVIIEPTSGNTGIGLAWVCARRNLRCIIVMPDSASLERRQLLEAYGAEVVLTPGIQGMSGAVRKAEALAREVPNSFIPSQFENSANPTAHYTSTGPEIWADTQGQLDCLIAGVGTGGTLTGAGRYLKERNPRIQVVAVEPAESPLLSAGYTGFHGIAGIGANFIPNTLDTRLIDRIMPVSLEDARNAAQLCARREGLLIGISSGAALHAALALAGEPSYQRKTMVVLFPDSGERYLSTGLYRD